LYLDLKIKEQKSFLKISHKFKVLFLKEDYFHTGNVDLNKEFITKDKENKINNSIQNQSLLKNCFSLFIKFIENELILFRIKNA